jgi:hypothetical protein
MHAQLICLNELIRFHSDHPNNQSSSSTAIIFTSLPPPEPGTSNSFEGPLSVSRFLCRSSDYLMFRLAVTHSLTLLLLVWSFRLSISWAFAMTGSARYLDQLESFWNDLPPVLAIYAKQFTVTYVSPSSSSFPLQVFPSI